MSACKISANLKHFWPSYGQKTDKIFEKWLEYFQAIFVSFLAITQPKMLQIR